MLTLPFLDNIVLYSSCWYESAWQPHLIESEAAASQSEVGNAFFIVGLSYMLTSLPAGAVSIPLAGNIFLSQIQAAWFTKATVNTFHFIYLLSFTHIRLTKNAIDGNPKNVSL